MKMAVCLKHSGEEHNKCLFGKLMFHNMCYMDGTTLFLLKPTVIASVISPVLMIGVHTNFKGEVVLQELSSQKTDRRISRLGISI